jgi:hypothetical protein
MPKLTYNGRQAVGTVYEHIETGETKEELAGDDLVKQWAEQIPSAERQRLHDLLDAAVDAYNGGDVRIEAAEVDFAGLAVTVELGAEGELAELAQVEEAVAQAAVDVGLEAGPEVAKQKVVLE